MQRFITVDNLDLEINKKLLLPDDLFHHAVHVLRMKIGNQFELVDATEQAYVCEIETLTKKEGTIKVVSTIDKNPELPINVSIVCGVSKGDKAEEIVKKGTQLGAASFYFINSKYSVARWKNQKQNKKINRLQTIAKNAAEQSHRLKIPRVFWLNDFSELIDKSENYDLKLIAYEESAKQGEKSALAQMINQLRQNHELSLIAFFGPEGGIAKDEVEQLTKNQFKCVALGPRILRAETAPLYLLSALSFGIELE